MKIINNPISQHFSFTIAIGLMFFSCEREDIRPISVTNPEEEIIIADSVFRLPVVVHVIHNGESIGEGSNPFAERIQRQIKIINEDFSNRDRLCRTSHWNLLGRDW